MQRGRWRSAIAATPADLLRLKKLAINRVMDVQGFRTAALYGAEWDAIAHFSPGAMEMSERMRTSGLKQAIEWMTERQAGRIAP